MGLRDKLAGCNEIGCDRARELFYDLAACQLSSEEGRALSLHESSCPACEAEFNEWRTLQSALQNSRVIPDTDFRAGVMARVLEVRAASRPSRLVSWQQGWVKVAAAAAVVVALMAGASKLPVTAGLVAWLNGEPRIVAQTPEPAPVVDKNPAPDTVIPDTAPPDTGEPTAPEQPAPPTQEKPTVPPATGENPQIADTGKSEVFLSQKRTITTTTLKVTVGDTEQAFARALEIAQFSGASKSWDQPGQSNAFIYFTIDPGGANAFLAHLRGLGEVTSEKNEIKDITGEYTRALETLSALRAKQAAAAEGDKGQYDSQISLSEYQLKKWDDALGKQAILLWLNR